MSGLCNQATSASPADVTDAEAAILAAIGAGGGGIQSATPIAVIGSTVTGAHTITGMATGTLRGVLNVAEQLSGVLDAGVFSTVHEYIGSGVLNFAALQPIDATVRDIAIRITLDGVVVESRSIVNIATANAVLMAIGGMVPAANSNSFYIENIPFTASLKIEVSSSLNETGKLLATFKYRKVT